MLATRRGKRKPGSQEDVTSAIDEGCNREAAVFDGSPFALSGESFPVVVWFISTRSALNQQLDHPVTWRWVSPVTWIIGCELVVNSSVQSTPLRENKGVW